MPSHRPPEHFVTLCDSSFLHMVMALHASLARQAEPFRLWVLCMDERILEQLEVLALANVSTIPLAEAETEELVSVKGDRSKVEYCWTLTPFVAQFVFERAPDVDRVTYLDTDLFFFESPHILLDEFDASGKDVLITEHAYAPEYDHTHFCGRFCVQFLTFRATPGAMKVMRWWQEACLDWCYFRYEEGRLGDQMYLDDWPERFAEEVHVLEQRERTIAPWNATHYLDRPSAETPVFYHFQGFRVLSERSVRWFRGYHIRSEAVLCHYREYTSAILDALARSKALFGTMPIQNDEVTLRRKLARLLYTVTGACKYVAYSLDDAVVEAVPSVDR